MEEQIIGCGPENRKTKKCGGAIEVWRFRKMEQRFGGSQI